MTALVETAAARTGLLLLRPATGVVGTAPVGSRIIARFRARFRAGARARTRAGTTRVDSGARHRVVLHATPDAEIEGWVILLVATRELDSSVRRSIATASNLHLGTSGSCYYLIQ